MSESPDRTFHIFLIFHISKELKKYILCIFKMKFLLTFTGVPSYSFQCRTYTQQEISHCNAPPTFLKRIHIEPQVASSGVF